MMRFRKTWILCAALFAGLGLSPRSDGQQRQLQQRSGVTLEHPPYPFDGLQSFGSNVFSGSNWGNLTNGINALHFEGCGYSSIPGYAGGQFQNTNCRVAISTSAESGWNRGNPNGWNAAGWFVYSHESQYVNCFSAGICNGLGMTFLKTSAGDSNISSNYAQCASGWIAASDEGCVGYRMAITEPGMVEGTVSSVASSGILQTITIHCTQNCYAVGSQRPLLNKTTGVLTGTLAAETGTSTGAFLEITGLALPKPSVCGSIAADVQTPTTRIDQKYPGMAISLTGLPAPLSAGQTVTVSQFSIENTVITSVGAFSSGAQTIIAPLGFPHLKGGHVCSGGLSGYRLEVAKYTLNGARPVFDIISSSSSGVTAVVRTQQGLGSESTIFYYGIGSPVNLYPGSDVVNSGNSSSFGYPGDPIPAVASSGLLTFSVDPSNAKWNVGDAVEVATLVSASITASKIEADPSNVLALVQNDFVAFNHNYVRSAIAHPNMNYSSTTGLRSHDRGPLSTGVATYNGGIWGAGDVWETYPEGWSDQNGAGHAPCILCFLYGWHSGSTLKSFNLMLDESQPGQPSETYYPATGTIQYNHLTPQYPALKALTGTRFVCIDTSGNLVSQTTACSGT